MSHFFCSIVLNENIQVDGGQALAPFSVFEFHPSLRSVWDERKRVTQSMNFLTGGRSEILKRRITTDIESVAPDMC
jgi:hypothetical protein